MNRRVVVLAVAAMISAGGGWLYWKSGDPSGPAEVSPTPFRFEAQTSEADTLSERLKRLERTPDDGVGWALLARSFAEAGRHADAASMYEKAMKLIPDDPQLLADYADTLGMLQGRKLDGRPEQLIQQALKIDPSHVKVLMLAGTAAFDQKEFGQAVRYWKQAGANLPVNGTMEARQELLASIAEAEELAAGKSTMVKTSGASPIPNAFGKQDAAISGTVSMAPGLSRKRAPTDTLFIFARGVSGPPMPVAIVRMATQDLPVTFRLDDSNSPMLARRLSEAGEVVIVARFSKSGEAMPKKGDLAGVSRVVRPGASQVAVVIERELP